MLKILGDMQIGGGLAPGIVMHSQGEAAPAPDIPQTNLALWLKADASYLFQDTAGTSPVTTNGQNVKKWLDAGPAANHLTEISGSPVSVWVASARNSIPGVRFNRSGFDVTALLPGTNFYDVWAVFNEDGGPSGTVLCGHKTAPISTGVFYPLTSNFYASVTNTAKDGTYYAEHAYTQTDTYTMYKGQANAVDVRAMTNDSSWTVTARPQVQVIEWNTVGGYSDQPTYGAKGDLCELIIYSANQSAGTHTAIDAYLNAKYLLF